MNHSTSCVDEVVLHAEQIVGATGALVGEAARTNQCRLLTRDLRARRTYDLLGVEYDFVDA